MSAKRTSWNEFSSSMASAVICLSLGDLSTHTTKYTSPALTQKVFANIRRVGKGFSGVETPLFEGMLVEQEVDKEGDADENVEEINAGDADKGDNSAAHGEVPTVTKEASIPSPTPPLQPPQDIHSTSQGEETGEDEQGESVEAQTVAEGVLGLESSCVLIIAVDWEHLSLIASTWPIGIEDHANWVWGHRVTWGVGGVNGTVLVRGSVREKSVRVMDILAGMAVGEFVRLVRLGV
nr:hypothetical protein [Tanacetum cinerariifolium]